MLVAVTGQLTHLDVLGGHCWLGLGAPESRMILELQVPASTIQQLNVQGEGAIVTLQTHLEFSPQGPVGALRPRLFGFAHALDRHFFLKLITVKGVGASVALDMMAVPTATIAAAIQGGDEAFLKKLPRIGASKARLLIAELRGKVAAFEGGEASATRTTVAESSPLDPVGQQVLAILTAQLDLEAKEARLLLERARSSSPEAVEVETLLTAVFAVRK